MLTWSNGFCDGRSKRGTLAKIRQGPVAKKCCYDKSFFGGGGREDEDKKRQENIQFFFSFLSQNCPFWAYIP